MKDGDLAASSFIIHHSYFVIPPCPAIYIRQFAAFSIAYAPWLDYFSDWIPARKA
jgi:hypothetical protein